MTLSIIAHGLSSAFGPTASETWAKADDRGSAYFAHPGYVGSDYQRQVCAFANRKAIGALEDRLPALLAQALTDLSGNASPPSLPYDIALCLPEAHTGDGLPQDRLNALSQALSTQAVNQLTAAGWQTPVRMVSVYDGSTGPISAIETLLETPDRGLCVIALDSYSDRQRLLALSGQDRLFSKAHPFGLVPGEACAAMLLIPTSAKQSPAARILSASTATEPVGEHEEGDSLFEGMSEALQAATEALTAPLTALVTDWNNSRYKAGEMSYALHRLPVGRTAPGLDPDHIAPILGDLGAATTLTSVLWQLPRGEGPIAVVAGSLYNKQRGTLVVTP